MSASEPAAQPAVTAPWASRFAGQLAWNVVSEVAARGASLWLSFWCARALPVSAFGRFTFALALTQYLWLLGDASANGGFAAREVARIRTTDADRAAHLAGRFLSLRLAAGVLLALGVGVTAVLLPMPAETRGALLGATVFLIAYAGFPDWALRAVEDFRGLAIANVLAAAALVGSTLLWLPGRASAGLTAALWGGSFALAALVAIVRLHSRGQLAFGLPHADDSRHWRRSAVFSLGALAGIGSTQAPLLIMGLLGEAHANGLFGASYRLVLAVLGVFSILWWPLFPLLARSRPESAEFQQAIAALARTALLLAVPTALAFLIWPREILMLAFGARYADGAAALRIAACGIPLYAFSGLLEQACLATGGEAMRARVYGLSLALMIAASFVLVPTGGAAGAAALLTLGFALSSIIFAVMLRHLLPMAAMAREARPVLLLAAALAALWVGCRLAHAPFVLSLVAGLTAWGGVVLACGWLRMGATPQPAPRERVNPGPHCRLDSFGAFEQFPFVSVLLAVRNEELHISAALDAVRSQDWPRERMEILVADGGSTDATRALVLRIAERDPRVRLLDNPARFVAQGLNVALAAAQGSIIVRVDGHCRIPSGYVRAGVEALRDGSLACAGGSVRALGETAVSRAIALAMSTPYGVGGASFRYSSQACDVDHLPFGVWPRGVFEQIGGFDEALVRNQDDELSDRLRRAGGRIGLLPGQTVDYWSRGTLSGLWRQYFGYGFWKVRVIRKRGGWPSSLRHLVPATFVLAVAVGPVFAALAHSWFAALAVPGLYTAFLLTAAGSTWVTRGGTACALLPLALPTMHVAYGVGFWRALVMPNDLTSRVPVIPPLAGQRGHEAAAA